MKPGAVVADRFVIERLAGQGGMGAVYRAFDRRGQRVVAVKVLIGQSHENAARFLREASLLAGLQHPGIVGFVGSGSTAEGEPFLAMDWLDGESLSERLAKGPLTVPETVLLGRRVATALHHAHGMQVIHRDLKPGNLFLPGGDLSRPLILDFGIARVTQSGHTITRTGVALGSPGYMSPEQARGERTVDGRADLFSLGCVLFRCLAGEPPFTGDALAAMLKAVMDPAPRLSSYRADIPPALEDLIQSLLAKQPDARPPDAAAVEAMLAAIAAGAPISPRTAVLQAAGEPPSSPATSAPVASVPVASVPVASVPVASVPASVSAVSVPLTGAAPASAAPIKARWIVGGAAAVIVLAAGVAAGVVLFLNEPAAGAKGPSAGAKGSSLACLSTRCQDITYPDPARVDPLEIWDRVMPLVKDVDPTATFTQLVIGGTTDGTVAVGDGRAKKDRALVYSFVTKSGRALDVSALPGRLIVQESNAALKPVHWPVCKPREALRAAIASGAPKGALATLSWRAGERGMGEWTYYVTDRAESHYRRIDGTACEVKTKGAK